MRSLPSWRSDERQRLAGRGARVAEQADKIKVHAGVTCKRRAGFDLSRRGWLAFDMLDVPAVGFDESGEGVGPRSILLRALEN